MISIKNGINSILCTAILAVGCTNESDFQPENVELSPMQEINQTSCPKNVNIKALPLPEVMSATKEILMHSIVIGGYFGASHRLGYEGLPKNTRQTEEGYWLGSRPNAESLEEFHARGVQLILTLSVIPHRELTSMQETIQSLGMKQIYIPFGSKFPPSSKFMPEVMSYQPEQILIHCEHGSDRTGAMAAFILATRHHWPIQKALFSMILPSTKDINSLSRILNSRGYFVEIEEYEPIIGMYSAEKNGGYGGMKVRLDGGNFFRLIETMITRKEAFDLENSKEGYHR